MPTNQQESISLDQLHVAEVAFVVHESGPRMPRNSVSPSVPAAAGPNQRAPATGGEYVPALNPSKAGLRSLLGRDPRRAQFLGDLGSDPVQRIRREPAERIGFGVAPGLL